MSGKMEMINGNAVLMVLFRKVYYNGIWNDKISGKMEKDRCLNWIKSVCLADGTDDNGIER